MHHGQLEPSGRSARQETAGPAQVAVSEGLSMKRCPGPAGYSTRGLRGRASLAVTTSARRADRASTAGTAAPLI